MKEALEANEVLLWGLNQLDSIIIKSYEQDYKKPSTKSNESEDKDLSELENIITIDKLCKTTDTEYNSNNKYNYLDLDFLNLEYERIDKKISGLTDLGDEFDNLMDLQDELAELIQELEYDKKNSVLDTNQNNNPNTNSDSDSNSGSDSPDSKNFKKVKKSYAKTKKSKPYYWIGIIPEGYREATQEEAIAKKKVSWFGKKKVSRQLYNLYSITGTLIVEGLGLNELSLKIASLKGKLSSYKKQIDFYKISLDSDNISQSSAQASKMKIDELTDCYKKTSDVLNLYIEQKQKYLSGEQINLNKKSNKPSIKVKRSIEMTADDNN